MVSSLSCGPSYLVHRHHPLFLEASRLDPSPSRQQSHPPFALVHRYLGRAQSFAVCCWPWIWPFDSRSGDAGEQSRDRQLLPRRICASCYPSGPCRVRIEDQAVVVAAAVAVAAVARFAAVFDSVPTVGLVSPAAGFVVAAAAVAAAVD